MYVQDFTPPAAAMAGSVYEPRSCVNGLAAISQRPVSDLRKPFFLILLRSASWPSLSIDER
jgi:hypothetical protein